MSSNCDSDGCPVDHDGHKLEDGVFTSEAPIAVRGDIFREIFSGSGRDVSGVHLEAHPLGGSCVKPSSLDGGIPVLDRVEIEDLGEGYESDEPLSPNSAAELCKNETSATVHAMLRSSKHEREALISARRRLADALSFLKSQGFKEEQIFELQHKDGFGSLPPVRDEYGLPVRKPNPLVDKMKEKMGTVSEQGLDAHKGLGDVPVCKFDNAHQVFVDSSVKVVSPGVRAPSKPVEHASEGVPLSQDTKDGNRGKSWSQVVNTASKPNELKLDFIPCKAGTRVVSPPIDVLKKGIEKFKCCLVGTFSKGSLPYHKVAAFAHKIWDPRGLEHVSQKDGNTFIFRFTSVAAMNSILARGTWYVEKKPMLVHAWGTSANKITRMPLWVRFERIPDCYWTREGISSLGSAIGHPLSVDDQTAKLEILPFAKVCVDYQIGDDLPTKVEVEVLDPVTEIITTEEVLVSYPNKPLACTGCKSLGHLIGACPTVVRKWVQKEASTAAPLHPDAPCQPVVQPPSNEAPPVNSCPPSNEAPPVNLSVDEAGWTQVKNKRNLASPVSPSTPGSSSPQTFKHVIVDEIAQKKLGPKPSKSARKKARNSGAAPPNRS